jgi:hypothetical protein
MDSEVSCMICGSIPRQPDTKTRPFALIACEYGPSAAGASRKSSSDPNQAFEILINVTDYRFARGLSAVTETCSGCLDK